ncbi:hypothetical protein FRX31_016152 [Thalictrum thalictroides]|uniref:Zinc knuckle CX2CX4HX4C domain-containing protein n=1 Tax=Thalictrum thalictroides TaxID=46969 RepID=A0A7J6WAD1_THATH|nr:hypothetical protein FRX31_016152 [Thalictrum thalictroides]
MKGDVWISFKYNGLPSLYCVVCRRLGHDRVNCHFPPENNNLLLLMIAYNGEEEDFAGNTQANDDQLPNVTGPTWPHDVSPLPSPSDFMGNSSSGSNNDFMFNNEPMSQAHNESEIPDQNFKKLIQLWAESGLLSTDSAGDCRWVGPTPSPPNSEPLTQVIPDPTNQTPYPDGLPNLNSLSSTEIPNETLTAHINPNASTIGIQINEEGDLTNNPRRRGRPIGSTNRKHQSGKGKGILINENDGAGGKKRKLS